MVEDIARVSGQSLDIEEVEREKLKSVFPQCFSEGKLDIDKLLNLCGEYIDEDFEKYKFEWKGKAECYRIAGKRSTGTLRPCPDESVNFDTTKNMYIEGDNLEVLKLLQTSYYRKVKMIYIDPPYNTGNDFVYEDDFADPMAKYKEITQQTTKSNPETMGRYHTNWLNMMYPRLRLASNLLRDDGVIFISIDDNEVTNLRKLCDEVFGEENFVCQFIWKSKLGKVGTTSTISSTQEYILCYGKQISNLNFKMIEKETDGRKENLRQWGQADRREDRPSMFYPITIDGIEVLPIKEDGTEGRWRVGKDMADDLLSKGLLELSIKDGKYNIYRNFEQGVSIIPHDTMLLDNIGTTAKGAVLLKELDMGRTFDYSKPIELVRFFAYLCTIDNDIVLDFFSGSATTAHAVMQLNSEDGGNRQFIMVQLPEICDEKSEAYKAGYKNICEIGKERIRRAGAKIDKGDTGFKVFKLDTSNLVKWDSTPTQNTDEVYQRMSLLQETIKPDRNDLDVVYETMLKLGIPLDYSVTEVEINDKKAYSIGEDCLVLICLDYGKDGITADDIKAMCDDYVPAKIVASEQAFKDDVALSNAHYILKDRNIEMKLL
ncbi:TPA: site-specific DNA-methyltransferase [Candidatus Gastranaerophilales bacterium HUM_15]|nr:MAG TPA: site-specific DNA-methyltransferase [Candidatus Gastranaerophilales bacterium HUM_15]